MQPHYSSYASTSNFSAPRAQYAPSCPNVHPQQQQQQRGSNPSARTIVNALNDLGRSLHRIQQQLDEFQNLEEVVQTVERVGERLGERLNVAVREIGQLDNRLGAAAADIGSLVTGQEAMDAHRNHLLSSGAAIERLKPVLDSLKKFKCPNKHCAKPENYIVLAKARTRVLRSEEETLYMVPRDGLSLSRQPS